MSSEGRCPAPLSSLHFATLKSGRMNSELGPELTSPRFPCTQSLSRAHAHPGPSPSGRTCSASVTVGANAAVPPLPPPLPASCQLSVLCGRSDCQVTHRVSQVCSQYVPPHATQEKKLPQVVTRAYLPRSWNEPRFLTTSLEKREVIVAQHTVTPLCIAMSPP